MALHFLCRFLFFLPFLLFFASLFLCLVVCFSVSRDVVVVISLSVTKLTMAVVPVLLFAGIADPNPITKDYAEHIEKFLPTMRAYNEHEAANHLESWIKGTLPKEPLLDVSA